ncbi:MAG TPA: hypothetical protein VFJ10_06215 [Acidobacteriaceae bacterium]|jgi:hypothetical protein|nr:hypothetical protein [Acidobacteriaceae bacterium]
MLETIIQLDQRLIGIVEKALEFLSDWFAITWKLAAEVLLGLMVLCGVTWAWHDHNPGQMLLLLVSGFGIKTLVVAGRNRASMLFRSRMAALVRTILLPLVLAHVSYFVHHPAGAGDRLLAVADWSALLLLYLLAAGTDGLRSRKRAASWDRIKALFGTGWVVAPAPAEE